MKIRLEQSGGVAAAVRRPARELDSGALPPPLQAELARLVAAAQADPPPDPSPGQARDALSYKITVDQDGGVTTLRGSDAAMSSAFSDLLEWLEGHMR